MYPPQFHIFRWSKNIKKPIVSVMTNEKAEEKVRDATLTYEQTITLEDENLNRIINKRFYNSKRRARPLFKFGEDISWLTEQHTP